MVAATVHLADYKPWAFALPKVSLDVEVWDDHVIVNGRLELEPLLERAPLVLQAVDLSIQSLDIDGVPLAPDAWTYSDGLLTIPSPPTGPFTLETRCQIDPYTNSSLEGLYSSGGLLSTQCEAEGFRRITPHPDRPDVLSRCVRIEASRSSCPVLLSNGNAVQEESVGTDRHAVTGTTPSQAFLFVRLGGGDLGRFAITTQRRRAGMSPALAC